MATNQLDRLSHALISQPHPRIGLIGDQALLGQALDHGGHGTWHDTQGISEHTHRDQATTTAFLGEVDLAQIILDCF